MKRLLSLFLCLAMLLTLLPTLALADDGKLAPVATRLQTVAEDGNTYVYCVYEGEAGYGSPYFAALEYVGHGDFTVTDLVIPATVPYEGQQVPLRYVGLPETSTFNYGPLYNLSGDVKDTVRTLEIPATVEGISKQAFQYFTSLTAVTLHEGLKSIGYCAFFGATSLTELTLPATLETLGEGAFKSCSDLVSVNFQDLTALREIPRVAFYASGVHEANLAEGLTKIGYQAFCGAQLQTVSFPATLETLEGECFKDCKGLETVTFPDQMNENFVLLTGFNNCSALKELRIPGTVQTVAASAFENSGLTSVTVPASVALIENKAFWMSKDLADLVILPGVTPLTIGPLAFYSCTALSDGAITLPKRVTELQEGCFSALWLNAEGDKPSRSPTFYVYNDRLRLADNPDYTQQNWEGGLPVVTLDGETAPDPWYRNLGKATVYYPETMTGTTSPSFMTYKALCEGDTGSTIHPVFSTFDATVPETYAVTGLVPEGATVTVASGGALIPVTWEGQRFTAQPMAGVDVTVSVSLDSYEDLTYQKAGADFLADWDLGEITVEEFISRSPNGTLVVNVTGAADTNLAVLDAEGNLAASGKAEGQLFLAADLPAGTYTVLGFGANPYVESVSAESDLAFLGISNYGKAENVVLKRGGQTLCDLAVPELDLGGGVLERSGLLLARQQLAPGTEFSVRINYKMLEGHKAERIDFQVPEGLTVLSVASENRGYAATSPLEPTALDSETGVLYLTLRAEQPGKYTVSATVTSGGIKVPLGSASCKVDKLVLELPETLTTDRDVPVRVYAAPNTEVTLKAGTGAETKVRTNARGLFIGSVLLPEDVVGGMRTAIIASTDEAAVHQSAMMAPVETRIEESYFIHAGSQTYGYQDGKNVSGGYYTYVSNGDEKNKYWTYSVTFEGALLTDQVTLNVYMMDGSVRHAPMTLASVTQGETGFRQTYVASVYIEQVGDHVFASSLIPVGYDVTFTYQGRPFTVDANTVIYIRQLAEIQNNDWSQGVEDIINEGGLEIGDVDDIFDYDSITNEDWFPELPHDVQDAALAYEDAIADVLDALLDLLGSQDDWDDLHDTDDLLESLGIDHEENVPYDPDALADDGFTVTPPDADGNSFAFRDTPTEDGSSRYEYRDNSGTSLTVDAQGNAINNAGMSAAGKAISDLSEAGADWMLKKGGLTKEWINAHPDAEDCFGKLGKRAKAAGSMTGAIFGLIQADNDSNDYIDAVTQYEKLKGELDNARMYQQYYKDHGYSQTCQWAIRDEIAAGERLLDLLRKQKYHARTDTIVGSTFTVVGVLAVLPSAGSSLEAAEGLNLIYDVLSNAINLNRSNQIVLRLADYVNAMNQRYQRCGSLKHKGDCSYITKIDPSGFVYEAVESNRLSGVTAVCYDVTNDTLWDGAPYDEINPQITGADGAFAWNVPAGDWRVDFTKEGYEPASTDTVTVPPPQTGLNVGLIATAGPEIASIHAYPDYVEVVFTQYMQTDAAVELGDWHGVWADPTPVSDEDSPVYATTLRLYRYAGKPQVGELMDVTLDGLLNYAGKPLSAQGGALTVEPRPATLELNYEEQIAVLLNETPIPRLTVRVLDAEGQPMAGKTVTAAGNDERFARVAAVSDVTDENGVAVFEIEGLLPGLTELTLQVENTALGRTLPLLISAETNQVARPTATAGETVISAGAPKDNYLTVPAGTLLTLACETEGTTIYYTLNDTCPCQDTANRIAYTEPIQLTEDGYYRITAYKPGMEYSERLNLHITIAGDPCEGFTDVDRTMWYHTAVDYALTNGLMNGTSGTTFEPDTTMTRSMLVQVLYNLEGKPTVVADAHVGHTDAVSPSVVSDARREASPLGHVGHTDAAPTLVAADDHIGQTATAVRSAGNLPAGPSFTDVKGDEWYAKAVLWAAANGIVSGYDTGAFGVNDPVTREQIASILYRYAGYKEADLTGAADLTTFPDGRTTSEWAAPAVAWAVNAGFISGKGQTDGTVLLAPQGQGSRAEVASMLMRFVQNVLTEDLKPVDWKKAYENKLRELIASWPESISLYWEYSLFDLNGDNVPELIVHLGHIEADAEYQFFTVNRYGVISNIGNVSGAHCYSYAPLSVELAVIIEHSHMGYSYAEKVLWNGEATIDKTIIYEYETEMGEPSFSPPSGNLVSRAPEFQLSDSSGLDWIKNPLNQNESVFEAIISEIAQYNASEN